MAIDKATQDALSGCILQPKLQSVSVFSCKKHPIVSCNTKKPELRYSVEELKVCSSNFNELSAMLSLDSCFLCSEEAHNSHNIKYKQNNKLL